MPDANDSLSHHVPVPNDVFERQAVLNRFGGDEQLLTDVVDAFTRAAPDQLRSIRELIDRADWGEVRRTVHGFRGACSNVGALRATTAALKLERDAEARAWPDAERSFRRLAEETQRYCIAADPRAR